MTSTPEIPGFTIGGGFGPIAFDREFVAIDVGYDLVVFND
jgi:hypothetical protein